MDLIRKKISFTNHKTNTKTLELIIASLPSYRVVSSAPFSKSGVDIAGPFLIHQRGRGNRSFKTFLAVFVCFPPKAVHLEIVEEY